MAFTGVETKRQFCESILRDHYGGDLSSDAERDIREILLLFYEFVPYFAKKNAFDNADADGSLYVDGQLITSKAYTVQGIDPQRGEKFIDLISTHIALPKNMGLHEVTAIGKGRKFPFIIGQNGQAGLFSGLPGGELTNKCYPEDKRVYFAHIDNGITQVLVKRAGSPGPLDLDSPVGILGEYLPEMRGLIMQKFQPYKPKDTLNDGNDA